MAEMLIIPVSKSELFELICDSVKKSLRDCASSSKPTEVIDDLLKIDQASKILQVSKVTLHKWKKTGKIPFHRISNRIFFKRSEIISALTCSLARNSKGGEK